MKDSIYDTLFDILQANKWFDGLLLRPGEEFDKTHTNPPILKKAPVVRAVGYFQASSETLQGLLNYHLHPFKLLSARAIPTR
ncbi:MAG: hypothetical protein JSU61_07065 [Fidelibacterota bacterium]|nr:MAG: hypothetical protein JSU61_07065 [Candidatus Neomarinimicrobiota bacterium]